jgi:hypothetical protein
MIEQLLNEIERARVGLQEWQRKEREAHDQAQMGLGYLQALARALELVQESGQKEEPPASVPSDS